VFADLGQGFSLLAFGHEDAAVCAFSEAAHAQGVPLKIIRASAEGRQIYGSALVLVRPDQFVAWASSKYVRTDAGAILQRATGYCTT
jgi:hypothetical protein